MFTPPKMTAAAGAVFALLILGVWTLPAGHIRGDLTGTLTDDRIALSFRIRDETQVTFRGRLVEGHMEGTCDYGDVAGGGTWTAERATSPWSF